MGCSSSTPIVKDEAVNKSTPMIHENRGKNITGGTEAMSTSGGGGTTHEEDVTNDTMDATKETIETTTASAVLGGNIHVRYACLSRRGRDPDDPSKPNQDAYSVHERLMNDDTASFFGVYDGHGPKGHECAQFVRKLLPQLVKSKLKENSPEYHQMSLHEAHVECNQQLRSSSINDAFSGTTCITMYVHGQDSRKLTICNVGDSRAVMGTPNKSAASTSSLSLRAVPLSKDQTPKRQDEATRCKKFGARILTFGEINPTYYQDDDDDETEDPPRVWSKQGNYPGVAFTRSIGDARAEELGVFAEPEQLTLSFSPKEVKIIVLASDGIFDVMTNQEVIDSCHEYYHEDPMQACRAVISKSHKEWLFNDNECPEGHEDANYDDMTMICIFLDDDSDDGALRKEGNKSDSGATAATPDKSDIQQTTAPQEPEKTQKKRVRHKQKTLRNLEEMEMQE